MATGWIKLTVAACFGGSPGGYKINADGCKNIFGKIRSHFFAAAVRSICRSCKYKSAAS